MKLGVNDPCPCGSGKKYKKCCLHKVHEQTTQQPPQLDSPKGLTIPPELQSPSSKITPPPQRWSALATPFEQKPPAWTDIALLPTPQDPIGISQPLLVTQVQTSQPLSPLLSWQPLGEKTPLHYVLPEKTLSYITPQNHAFHDTIQLLITRGTSHDMRTALQMLDTIPHEEQLPFGWITAVEALCLQKLDRKEDALWCYIQRLLAFPIEELWYPWGPVLLQWMQIFSDSPRYPQVLDTLRKHCANTDLGAIQLALATGLCQDDSLLPSAESVSHYQLALRPERWSWKSPHFLQGNIANWLGAFSVGLSRMMRYAYQQQDGEQLRYYTKMCYQPPWNRLSYNTDEKVFSILCETFFHIQLVEPIFKLGELFKTWIHRKFNIDYWMAQAAWYDSQLKRATHHALKMVKYAHQLSDVQRFFLTHFFLNQKHPEQARLLLDSFQQKDSSPYLKFEFWYHSLIEDFPNALPWIERFLELEPNHFEYSCRWLAILAQLNHTDKLESELQRRLLSPDELTRQLAHAHLASLRHQQQRYEEALTLLQAIPNPPDERIFLKNKTVHSYYHTLYAELLEQVHRQEEAEHHIHRAIEILPDVWNTTRLLIHYYRNKRWEDAEKLLPSISVMGGESFYTQHARLQIALHHKDFTTARSILVSVGRQPFEKHQLFDVWLVSWIQILHAQEDTCEALRFTEEHLDAILAEPELREIRKMMIQEIIKRHQSLLDNHSELEQRFGQQHRTEQKQTSELRLQLEQAIMKNQRFQEGFQRALRDHQSLQSKMRSLYQQSAQHDPYASTLQHAQEALAVFAQQHSSLLTSLSPETHNYLLEAERFWYQTVHESINDYAPFIVQYARALEREINVKLIDPLVAWTLSQGGKLSDFPVATTISIKPRQNQLSLGDATKMLYHRIVYTDNQGATVIQRNPVSFPEHQNILRPFWNKTASLFGGSDSRTPHPTKTSADSVTDVPANAPFILDLQEFTQLRNRASHARDADHLLTKQDAERIRLLTLGDHASLGLLARITQLHRAFFLPPPDNAT